ncbi:hypothetical protein BDF22DRAFT_665223 [Syncephalis plumigaleata]|nr:hypothetical protein BDF22DRAFT_665223 [Syncephalis plumigaleata]
MLHSWLTTIDAVGLLLAALVTQCYAVQVYNARTIINNYNVSEFLLDTGNWRGTDANVYYKGRFSNGRVWSEWLADGLGVPLVTLAFGGALSGARIQSLDTPNNLSANNWVPTAYEQAKEYFHPSATQLKLLPSSSPVRRRDGNPLYILQVGGNDYVMGMPMVGHSLKLITELVDRIVTSMMDTVKVIQEASNNSARVLVMGMPPLDYAPLHKSMHPRQKVNARFTSDKHNEMLLERLTDMQQQMPDAHLHFYNVTAFTVNAHVRSHDYYFSNIRDSCLSSTMKVCNDPDSHFFWDGLHPTRAVHQKLGHKVLSLLQPLLGQ